MIVNVGKKLNYVKFSRLGFGVGGGVLQLLQLGVVADSLGVDDVADGFVLPLQMTCFQHLLLDALNGRRQRLVFPPLLIQFILIQLQLLHFQSTFRALSEHFQSTFRALSEHMAL